MLIPFCNLLIYFKPVQFFRCIRLLSLKRHRSSANLQSGVVLSLHLSSSYKRPRIRKSAQEPTPHLVWSHRIIFKQEKKKFTAKSHIQLTVTESIVQLLRFSIVFLGFRSNQTEVTEMEGTSGPCMQLATTTNSDLESKPKPQVIYRCKRCRRIVAAQENIVPHERGQGEKCFKWRKRSGDLTEKEPSECSSIFVEPMKWMQAVHEGHVEEKLQCMGCKARLGSFNWAGMQCSCGAWVNPAFQLHKNRLDECQT